MDKQERLARVAEIKQGLAHFFRYRNVPPHVSQGLTDRWGEVSL